MQRSHAAALAVAALVLAAATARAQESDGCSPREPAAETTPSSSRTDGMVEEVTPAQAATAEAISISFTDAEREELRKLAAEKPELADQAGGYMSDRDLIILLIVLILVFKVL